MGLGGLSVFQSDSELGGVGNGGGPERERMKLRGQRLSERKWKRKESYLPQPNAHLMFFFIQYPLRFGGPQSLRRCLNLIITCMLSTPL